MTGNLDLIALQAATLFRLDAGGRLLANNDPDHGPAARLFVGRTTAGLIWRFRHDLPPELVRELDRLLSAEPVVPDLRRPLRCQQRLHDALAAHAPVTSVWEGPAWYCPAGIAAPGAVDAVEVADPAAFRGDFAWLAAEYADWQPCRAVLRDGAAVSVCFSSRNTPRAAEAGVRTAEGHQRRGYAAAVVAAWAAAVRASGRLPLYSTSWDNLASQGVARALGLVLYGADLSFT